MKLKKHFSKFLTLALIVASFLCLPVVTEAAYIDEAGNAFSSNDGIAWSENVGNELFLAGQSISVYDTDIESNAFMAGKNISTSNVNIGGSAFLAGYLVIIDSNVDHNIWAAGNTIITNPNTVARSFKAAAEDLTIEGQYDTVSSVGSKIFFNAKSSGNVTLEGEEITIGQDAVVDGVLTVKSTIRPSIPETSSINEFNFIQKEETRTKTPISSQMVSIWIFSKLTTCAYWLMAFAVMAFVFACIIPEHMETAKDMVLKKPVAMMVTGFFGIVFVPITILFMCITFIGLPLAGLTGMLYASLLCFSRIFAFASFGRHLMFGKAQKRLHPVAETILSVLPAAVIKVIPVIGSLVGVLCISYTLGYTLLAGYNALHKNKPLPETTTIEE